MRIPARPCLPRPAVYGFALCMSFMSGVGFAAEDAVAGGIADLFPTLIPIRQITATDPIGNFTFSGGLKLITHGPDTTTVEVRVEFPVEVRDVAIIATETFACELLPPSGVAPFAGATLVCRTSPLAFQFSQFTWRGTTNDSFVTAPVDVRYTITSTTTDPTPSPSVQFQRVPFGIAATSAVPTLSPAVLALLALMLAAVGMRAIFRRD